MCTESIDCSITEDTVMVQVAATLTVDGDSASGQETVTVMESGESLACTYDIALSDDVGRHQVARPIPPSG
jgi:hypothetical protein